MTEWSKNKVKQLDANVIVTVSKLNCLGL